MQALASDDTAASFRNYLIATVGTKSADKALSILKNRVKGMGNLKDFNLLEKELAGALQDRERNKILSSVKAYAMTKAYEQSVGPLGFWSSESAVASRWYTHDTARSFPGQAILSAELTKGYLNVESIASGGLDQVAKGLLSGVGSLFSGGGGKK